MVGMLMKGPTVSGNNFFLFVCQKNLNHRFRKTELEKKFKSDIIAH